MSLALAEMTIPDLSLRGPVPFAPRPRTVRYNLDFVALDKLTAEEEQLAYWASTDGLTAAGQHRLDAIEKELDRRWKFLK